MRSQLVIIDAKNIDGFLYLVATKALRTTETVLKSLYFCLH